MNKTTAWVLIIVAFIIGGAIGFLAERQRATDKMEAFKLQVQKTLDKANIKAQKAEENLAMTKAAEIVVMAEDPKLGEYATAENGMALYTFDKDTASKSNCTGQCAVNWPPYTVTGSASSALPQNVGTIKRADGSAQYTWDGKPLYFYIKDVEKGDVKGEGFGGVWHLAK